MGLPGPAWLLIRVSWTKVQLSKQLGEQFCKELGERVIAEEEAKHVTNIFMQVLQVVEVLS